MKLRLLSFALLAAGLVGAASPLLAAERTQAPAVAQSAINAPDPAQQIKDLARLFRNDDVAGLAEALTPPDKWSRILRAYELHRVKPLSPEDRAEFAEKVQRFIAPDAVDQLMQEIEPKLAEARPQVPGALLMAFGAMQMAVTSPDSDLTIDQRAALQSAMPGLQAWATTTDFLSSDTMRQALTLLTDAARRTGVGNVDELRALPLEAALDRAGTVFAAAKDAVRLYGIDLDQVADSLQVEVLAIEGDTARVRTTVKVFDAPVWAEHELVLVDGRWYGKQSVLEIGPHEHEHDDVEDEDVEKS